MTPPIDPEALHRVLQTLPPEEPDPFPHLANLSPDALLSRRVEVTGTIKTLEQERQAIDAELLSAFGDAELRFGVRAPGGWVLKQRSRTSWQYDPEAVTFRKVVTPGLPFRRPEPRVTPGAVRALPVAC